MSADQLDLLDLLPSIPPLGILSAPASEPEPGSDCDCEGDGDFHPYGSGGCVGADLRAMPDLAATR